MNLIKILGIRGEQAAGTHTLRYANCQVRILAFANSLI